MAYLFTSGKFQAFDSNGDPLSGGFVYTWAAGGIVTPLATYTTQSGGTSNANPVELDAAGRAAIWLGSSSYRFVVKDADGLTVEDTDNVIAPVAEMAALLIADDDADEGAGMVGYSATIDYPVGTVGHALNGALASYYSSVGGGNTDELATFQAAIVAAYGGKLILESGATYLIDGTLEIDDDIEITTDGAMPAIIETVESTGIPIDIGANVAAAATTTLAANASIYSRTIAVTSATGIAAGQLMKLQSNKAWYIDARETTGIDPEADAAGTAVSGTTTTMVLEVGTTYTGFVGKSFTIESGTNLGFARVVTGYDSGTRTATFAALPSAIDNTSVYRFPELFKGELHRVRSVDGTTVELEDALFDGYDVVNDTYGDNRETVTLTFYEPLTVRIDNIRVSRTAEVDANSWLMRLSHCVNHEVSRFSGENGSAVGVQDVGCYGGRYSKLDIKHSNDTTTGYGLQFYGSTYCEVVDSDFAGCRRGVDVSGTIPSSFCVVQGNRNYGGGEQEDGQAYYPIGTVANYGFGSHGTARGTAFRENIVTQVGFGINLRGRDEKVVDNYFYGEITNCCVYLFYGLNTIIKGNVYTNLYAEGTLANSSAQAETNSFEADNINGRQPKDFIQHSFARERGFVEVSDNVAWGIRRYFFGFPNSGGETWYDLSLRNNRVNFAPGTVSDEVALIGTDTGSVGLLNLTMGGNEFTGGSNLTALYRLGTNIDVADSAGSSTRYGDSYVARVYIADDAVGQIRVGQTGDQCRFELYTDSTVAYVFNGMLTKTSTTMTSLGVQTLVLGLATVPAGTTGTDARVNVHYSGTYLYIENRTGAARRFHITVHPMR